jgi:hypothetical protein
VDAALKIEVKRAEKGPVQQLPTPPPTAPLTPELHARSIPFSSVPVTTAPLSLPASPPRTLSRTSDLWSDIPIHSLAPQLLEPPESSLDSERESQRISAYFELKQRLEAAGLFTRSDFLRGYGPDLARYLLLGSTAFALFFL